MLPDSARQYLAEIGAKGGHVGGKSRSPAKIEAGRKNAAKARAARAAKRLEQGRAS